MVFSKESLSGLRFSWSSSLTSTSPRDEAPQVLNMLLKASGSAGKTHFSCSQVSTEKSKRTTFKMDPPSMG